MFVTNWISPTKIQKISEITNFFRHYFLSRTEVLYGREACQCNRTLQESYQRIFEHLKEIQPDASDKQIQKMIG